MQDVRLLSTYPKVPAGRVDICVSISGFALDMPKSDTLAIILLSSRMLLGFTSLWITGGSWIDHVRYIMIHPSHISHIHTSLCFWKIYILLLATSMLCTYWTYYLNRIWVNEDMPIRHTVWISKINYSNTLNKIW